MNLGNLSAVHLPTCLLHRQTTLPFSSQGLVTEIHKVVQLHRQGWFLQGPHGPLQ